jgi:hypothetical protein
MRLRGNELGEQLAPNGPQSSGLYAAETDAAGTNTHQQKPNRHKQPSDDIALVESHLDFAI